MKTQMSIPITLATTCALVLVATAWSTEANTAVDAAGTQAASLLELEAERIDGAPAPLSRYAGQVLLIVNTASRCGYTPQYAGLQDLHERYGERGFAVLGFPSNDFGAQEPGSNAEIGAFCRSRYGVEFPMFAKVRVRGSDAHPVYAYLTSLPEPIGGPVEWNFQKYLVDRNGEVVARYASGTSPEDPALREDIERLLASTNPAR